MGTDSKDNNWVFEAVSMNAGSYMFSEDALSSQIYICNIHLDSLSWDRCKLYVDPEYLKELKMLKGT